MFYFTALQFLDLHTRNQASRIDVPTSASFDSQSGHDRGDEYTRQNSDVDNIQSNILDLEDVIEEQEIDKNERQEWSVGLPTIFAITPTYQRFLQKAELTRVSNTFHLVPNFHWIVVEDSAEKTRLVENFLNQSGLDFTHLNIRTPRLLRRSKSKPRWTKSRGLEQRNKALDWLRENVNPNTTRGVVYFADDDNTYDRRLFEEVNVQTNKF